PLTCFLVSAQIGILALAWLIGGDATVERVFRAGSTVPDRVWAGEWWRLLTSMFVHADWDHVLGNSLTLLVLGARLAPVFGSLAFTELFLLGGLASSVAEMAFCPTGSGGSSGAIFALLGALLAHPIGAPRRLV